MVLTQELVIGVIRPARDAGIDSNSPARSTCLDLPCIPLGVGKLEEVDLVNWHLDRPGRHPTLPTAECDRGVQERPS